MKVLSQSIFLFLCRVRLKDQEKSASTVSTVKWTAKAFCKRVIRNFVLRTFRRFYLIKECEILDVNCNKCKKKKGKIVIFQKLSRLSLIVRVNVVLNRTIVVDSDWRFDNLCSSHLQSQSELYHVSWWYYTLVIGLIGQLRCDVVGRLSVKPWCYWLWRLVISNWCVSIRLRSQLNSRLLLVKLSVLQSFSRS